MKEPVRQIAYNAGLEGAVIVDTIKRSRRGFGFNALTEEYVDMIEAGIVDPTKVTRSALQNAASIAAMVLTTESVVADKPAKEGAAPMGGMPMGGGMPGDDVINLHLYIESPRPRTYCTGPFALQFQRDYCMILYYTLLVKLF